MQVEKIFPKHRKMKRRSSGKSLFRHYWGLSLFRPTWPLDLARFRHTVPFRDSTYAYLRCVANLRKQQ
jgi:hypothetical protein